MELKITLIQCIHLYTMCRLIVVQRGHLGNLQTTRPLTELLVAKTIKPKFSKAAELHAPSPALCSSLISPHTLLFSPLGVPSCWQSRSCLCLRSRYSLRLNCFSSPSLGRMSPYPGLLACSASHRRHPQPNRSQLSAPSPGGHSPPPTTGRNFSHSSYPEGWYDAYVPCITSPQNICSSLRMNRLEQISIDQQAKEVEGITEKGTRQDNAGTLQATTWSCSRCRK